MNGSKYYAIIADKVADQFSNNEILLLCLHYVTFQNDPPRIQEQFYDSLHIDGRPTGQAIVTT